MVPTHKHLHPMKPRVSYKNLPILSRLNYAKALPTNMCIILIGGGVVGRYLAKGKRLFLDSGIDGQTNERFQNFIKRKNKEEIYNKSVQTNNRKEIYEPNIAR